MKKIWAIFLLSVLFTTNANAEGKTVSWKGSGNCYRDTYYEYGFICGTSIGDNTKCGGKKAKNLKKKYFYDNGECFAIDHADSAIGKNISYFCCCNNTWKAISTNKNGVYNSGTLGGFTLANYTEQVWYTKSTATATVSGGTCTYEKRVNMCGTEISTPCKTPTSCNNGLVKRNGVCTTPCPEGQAWESNQSNKCVACKTTYYQGITNDTASDTGTKIVAQGFDNKICTKCNQDTQFFKTKLDNSKTVGECVAKSSLTKTSKETMKKCTFCATDTIVKDCMKCFSEAEENTTDSVTAKQQCVLTYATDCLISE